MFKQRFTSKKKAEPAKKKQVELASLSTEFKSLLAKFDSASLEEIPGLVARAMSLIARGVDPAEQDETKEKNTLLHYLVYLNQDGEYDEHVSKLARMRPELLNLLNGERQTPVFKAVCESLATYPLPQIKKLVALGARIDMFCPVDGIDSMTLLHLAAYEDEIKLVKYLIAQKLDINAQSSLYKNTALIWAAAYKRHEMITFLIESGANESLTDVYDRKPRIFLSFYAEREKDSRDALSVFDKAIDERNAAKGPG